MSTSVSPSPSLAATSSAAVKSGIPLAMLPIFGIAHALLVLLLTLEWLIRKRVGML